MKPLKVLQVAFTYMGTVVGAGFATGQEILQFFTRFGFWGAAGIGLSTMMFIWLGAKMMLIAYDIGARSYEDLNKVLFGERLGVWVSHFMLIVLVGVNAVMLAGAGSIFHEHLGLSYQAGLLLTMLACFLLLRGGMSAIMTINTIVVPIMLLFTVFLIIDTLQTPGSDRWLLEISDLSPWAAWASPFLYAAFNLCMAQAVLVPLGREIADRRTIIAGAWTGGIGIGFMLLVGHIALSTYMPGIAQYAIPMGGIARELGIYIQWIYLFLIFAEIFTTLVSDIFGLTLQLEERLNWPRQLIVATVLVFCYSVSQFGFGTLLGTLYPAFGAVALGWLLLIVRQKTALR